jgi:anti-sigma regulatory factor (Ser/Thr protein kinase)
MMKKTLKEKVLDVAKKRTSIRSTDIVDLFSISRQQASLYLKELVEEGKLMKIGSTRSAFYILAGSPLPTIQKRTLTLNNAQLKEHEVLQKIRDSFQPLKLAQENLRSIFDFAFSEMLNNAIEHSKSKQINIEVSVDRNNLDFVIHDQGIGVFRNVMKKRDLKNELEAMQDLLKGKTTTAPQAHSGEGIFFTSKMADLFILESFNWRLRVDNTLPDIFFEPLEKSVKGTRVVFSINSKTKKHASDIFNAYTSDDDDRTFSKTETLVRLYATGTIYVSRSQARRILSGLEQFKTIILDFKGVPTIGQAFADEIFRVFPLKNPSISIETRNANEAVQFMIDHAKKE